MNTNTFICSECGAKNKEKKQELDWNNYRILKYLTANPQQTTHDITTALGLYSNNVTSNRLRYLEYMGLVRKEKRNFHFYWSIL